MTPSGRIQNNMSGTKTTGEVYELPPGQTFYLKIFSGGKSSLSIPFIYQVL